MSKYSAASDGKGNVKVFRTDSGVNSYSINKSARTKINNVQVSGDVLTVTSTNEYGVIKADVYKDINKGILSYSNVIGHEERPSKETSSNASNFESFPSQSASTDTTGGDCGDVGALIVFVILLTLIVAVIVAVTLIPLLSTIVGTMAIGFGIYYIIPWVCRLGNGFDNINLFISAYFFLCVYKIMQHDYPPITPLHGWGMTGHWSSLVLISGLIVFGSKRIIDNILPSMYMFFTLVLIYYKINYVDINNIVIELYNWIVGLFN